jgi:hypothetical protein
MTQDQQIQAVLSAMALAGGAWQQINTTEPPIYPYIVWTNVVSTTNNNLQGASDLQNTRLQVDVYSRQASERATVADAAVAAMTAGPFDACIQLSSQDLYESEVRAFRRILEFSVWSKN